MSYKLTVGKVPDGREIAVITEGGHPQFDNAKCTVCSVAVVSELPGQDASAWFEQQVRERPWETRQ